MRINYYDIHGCIYQKYHEAHYIFAPEDTAGNLLEKYDFQQTGNGNYYKILSEAEYQTIMQGYSYQDIYTDSHTEKNYYTSLYRRYSQEDNYPAFRLSLISGVLFFAGCGCLHVSILLGAFLEIISLILAIAVCVRHSEDFWGKTMILIMIPVMLLLSGAFIEVCSACYGFIENFLTCLGSGMG